MIQAFSHDREFALTTSDNVSYDITVCARWMASFDTFIADIGSRPSDKHSIERIDNDKGYEPGNCRWALHNEQMRNTRLNRMLAFGGKIQTLSDWARELGIKTNSLWMRLEKHPVEVALSMPCRRRLARHGIKAAK
jgi:hypothetical protein